MNNYAYLIKAKAKATEAKSIFCWFSAKSDSRADREILNILEDEGITVGRAADHQLPIRTNFPVLDDLPVESVLDDTWCDRYQLDDNNCWQKIVVESTTESNDYLSVRELSPAQQVACHWLYGKQHPSQEEVSTINEYLKNNDGTHNALCVAAAALTSPDVLELTDKLAAKLIESGCACAARSLLVKLLAEIWHEKTDEMTGQDIALFVQDYETCDTEDERVAVVEAWTRKQEPQTEPENLQVAVASMSFRRRLLAQYLTHELVTIADTDLIKQIADAETDTDNSYVQNLLLAAENAGEFKDKANDANLSFLCEAIKSIWPSENKKPELNQLISFIRDWWITPHINRGVFVKAWRTGKPCGPIPMKTTDTGTNAGGVGKTDRGDLLEHSLDTLDIDIAAALLPMDFDIYAFPRGILQRSKDIVKNKQTMPAFSAWSELLRKTAGILDYSRAAIFALIRQARPEIHLFPSEHLAYISKNLTETDHANPSAELLAAARHLPSPEDESTDVSTEDSLRDDMSKRLAAGRGEFVEGISDPNDPEWVHEDLTKPRTTEVCNVGNGIFSIDNLITTVATPDTAIDLETTSNVQMEETRINEATIAPEVPISKTATDTTAGNVEDGDQTDPMINDTGHHNDDYRHLMVDLETMGNKSNAPIVSIGAVFFNPNTGNTGAEFYTAVSLESSMLLGGVPDAGTIIWWLKQSPEARSAIAIADTITLIDALELFSDFISENSDAGPDVQVWGNGASFDNVILRSSYDRANIECPWKFRNDRDVRTMTELGKAIGINPRYDIPFDGDMHNALSDARHQVKYVSAIWQKLTNN
ncbi:MAG: 3'-5' exoribonuclease [Kluyvera cryocrescens]|uniref:exonuclease n=1 Tax=Kluyvera cryocrescens TaxID=580 RepID=UPI000D8A9914|nr:exonuclease [Kluyvera cryocrescens]MDU5685434.1 3'-5' exoribonuclease [Kluyvera cryocrescens]SQC35925.1 Exodeoxyribonuclease 8 [Kluyvera cryocrescens]